MPARRSPKLTRRSLPLFRRCSRSVRQRPRRPAARFQNILFWMRTDDRMFWFKFISSVIITSIIHQSATNAAAEAFGCNRIVLIASNLCVLSLLQLCATPGVISHTTFSIHKSVNHPPEQPVHAAVAENSISPAIPLLLYHRFLIILCLARLRAESRTRLKSLLSNIFVTLQGPSRYDLNPASNSPSIISALRLLRSIRLITFLLFATYNHPQPE